MLFFIFCFDKIEILLYNITKDKIIYEKEAKTMKKKQPNLNYRKELLKNYITKLTNNRVVLIDNDVVRASNLTYSICQNRTKVDLGEVKLTVNPYSYNKTKVYSSVLLQLFKKGEEVWCHRTQLYANQYYLNFVSELNRVQIEKLIKALAPIIDKIDKEISEIEKEENQAELTERNEITRRLKRNITTKVDFEKLNLRELKQLDNLIKKMKK
jgi:hypothetical protein